MQYYGGYPYQQPQYGSETESDTEEESSPEEFEREPRRDEEQVPSPKLGSPRSPKRASPRQSSDSTRSPSSKSSASSSADLQEQEGFMDRNYQSAGEDSSVELNEPIEEVRFDPVNIEQKKQVRSAGKTFTFSEKHFKSKIEDTI